MLKKTLSMKLQDINLRLLPIKLHYFLFWGGVGSSAIFIPLLAKQVGISASAVGVMYTVSSLTTLISQPLFGAISDRFQKSRSLVIMIVVTYAVTSLALLYIPPIPMQINEPEINLDCTKTNLSVLIQPSYNLTCISSILNHEKYCLILKKKNIKTKDNLTSILCNDYAYLNVTEVDQFHKKSNNSNCKRYLIKDCDKEIYWMPCDLSLDSCFIGIQLEKTNIYWVYQLWIFSVFTVISQTMMYTCFSLSDAMCYKILGENNEHLFGDQRLWSVCSYGLASLIAGYFNDILSRNRTSPCYSIGFYIMVGLLLLDIVALSKIPPVKVKMKVFSLKNIGKTVITSEIVTFLVAAFLIGILTAIIWNYQFLFLTSIGASQTLIGLTSSFQSLIADMLFFKISGKIIKLVGHFYCLLISFSGFAIRYCLYYVLQNPWHMLPIEILDGVTFSLFYVTLTGFAKVKAPLGNEATMVGLLLAAFEGLGVASGSLLGGIGYDYFGARGTFLIASIGSMICVSLFSIMRIFINRIIRVRT